jgi:hypothetical protein
VVTDGARTAACEALCARLASGLQAVFRHRFFVTHRAYLQVTWTRSRQGGIRYTFAAEFPSLRVVGDPKPTVVTSEHVLSDARVEALASGAFALDASTIEAIRETVHEAVDHILRKLIARAYCAPVTPA